MLLLTLLKELLNVKKVLENIAGALSGMISVKWDTKKMLIESFKWIKGWKYNLSFSHKFPSVVGDTF